MGRKERKKLEQSRGGWSYLVRRRKLIIAILLVLLFGGGSFGAWKWNRAPAAPEPAPRFNLLASTGRVITLDDYLGKQEVVLFFYMAFG
jgi:cytochrome oxidase Cu insertion factor (SCO1/SenC/PrrC family)